MKMYEKSILAAVAFVLAPLGAEAKSGFLTTFNSTYGTAKTTLDSCATCHGSTTSTYNPYGTDVRAKIGAGIDAALAAVEPLDSDGDRFSNLDEITALTLPGDRTSFPAVTPTTCPDADRDGHAVCDGVCALPTGAQCGDCNDAVAAVNPGVTELCSNAIDDNCDGAIDAKDPVCAAPALSDFDIASVRATARTVVGRKATFKVNVVQVVGGAASLTVQYTQGGVTTTLGTVSPLQAGAFSFVLVPTLSGPVTWNAIVTDQDPDADVATAVTTVK
jgi:hypothetical protein